MTSFEKGADNSQKLAWRLVLRGEGTQEWKLHSMIEASKHSSSVQMLIIYVAKK